MSSSSRSRVWRVIAFVAAVPSGITAQTPSGVVHAAETAITADTLERYVSIFAADSLRDRATPSPGLDRAAAYLAAEFARLGIEPAESTLVLRYSVPGQRRFNYAASRIIFLGSEMTVRGHQVVQEEGNIPFFRYANASLDSAAHFSPAIDIPVVAQGAGSSITREISAGSKVATLVAGPQTPTTLAAASLAERVVFYVPPTGIDSAAERQVIRQLYAASRGVVVLRSEDSAAFVAASPRRTPLPIVDGYMSLIGRRHRWPWAIDVRADVVAGLLAVTGVDIPTLRAATTPVTRNFEVELLAALDAQADSTTPSDPVTAPIVVGMIPGTDSVLAKEYVLLAMVMDTPSDSTRARAGNANLAGLLVLARAFRDPAVRPRRSILFVATSGEVDRDATWGGHFLVQKILQQQSRIGPGVFRSVLLQFDVSAAAGDSLFVEGRDALDLTPPPAWVAAAHPTLNVVPVDLPTSLTSASIAGAFVTNNLPAMGLRRGRHGATTGAREDDGAIRALRYLFYLGYELANAPKAPRWSESGRRALLNPP